MEAFIKIGNLERDKLLLLADKGIPLLLRSGFISNDKGQITPLRETYTAVISAVNRLLVENFHELGLTFILSKKTASELEDIHFSPLHWTEKQGKRQGRPIVDRLDGGSEEGNGQLNSNYTKEESDHLWAKIKHPSIENVAEMILTDFEKAKLKGYKTQWEDVVLLKKD